MRRMAAAAAVFCCVSPCTGIAGSSYVLPDGISRAPAVTLHCAGSGSSAAPCGTSALPVVVAPSAGFATSANQGAELSVQQSLYQSLGTQSDPVYSSGPGSIVSLLKALAAALTSGTPALPVGGQPISRSTPIAAAQSVQVFPANAARHYLGFQAPQNTAIWVNFLGGVASANGTDCVLIPAGTIYESGQFVDRGAVTIYAPVAVTIAAWEG